MNRGIGNGPRPTARESRRGRLLSCPVSANRYRWRAAEVAAVTADLRGQGQSGNPARSAEPARSQPGAAECR
jgi:hypothetical protein